MQGVCFHLYSKARSNGLAEYQLPELQRSPLDELSLQVKLLRAPSKVMHRLQEDLLHLGQQESLLSLEGHSHSLYVRTCGR